MVKINVSKDGITFNNTNVTKIDIDSEGYEIIPEVKKFNVEIGR